MTICCPSGHLKNCSSWQYWLGILRKFILCKKRNKKQDSEKEPGKSKNGQTLHNIKQHVVSLI